MKFHLLNISFWVELNEDKDGHGFLGFLIRLASTKNVNMVNYIVSRFLDEG